MNWQGKREGMFKVKWRKGVCDEGREAERERVRKEKELEVGKEGGRE